jgi:glycosyltransferase involved in cell wall biosynthesis
MPATSTKTAYAHQEITPTVNALRIVQLITGSDAIGGAQTHVRDLIGELRSYGHECTVLVGPPDGSFCKNLRQSGVSVRIIPSLRKKLTPWHDALAFAQILTQLHRLKPDIVAAHTAKASFLGRFAAALLGIPCVFTSHGCSIIDRQTGQTRRVFVILERIARHLGSKLITVSDQERRLAEGSGIVDRRNLAMVYNGIPDLDQLADPSGQPAVITMVARFDPPKDHVTLLLALAELSNYSWTLRLAGTGTLLDHAKRLAAELEIGDRIQFLGECLETSRLLAESQIFVLSSRSEAFPISILEAMRAGLPVIASDVGGVSEAVRDGETGFVVPACDHRALTRRLRQLLSDPRLRMLLGWNARRRYLAHFTADSMAAATLAVYRDALVSRTSRVIPPSLLRARDHVKKQTIASEQQEVTST